MQRLTLAFKPRELQRPLDLNLVTCDPFFFFTGLFEYSHIGTYVVAQDGS